MSVSDTMPSLQRPQIGTKSLGNQAQFASSSVLLCDDGTVISIYDTPEDAQPQELETIRRNQVNILDNLSKQYDASLQNPLFQVNIRPMSASNGETNEEYTDTFSIASRLFYYLFDDWRATFELV